MVLELITTPVVQRGVGYRGGGVDSYYWVQTRGNTDVIKPV